MSTKTQFSPPSHSNYSNQQNLMQQKKNEIKIRMSKQTIGKERKGNETKIRLKVKISHSQTLTITLS